jgi:hypothetical protein
MNLFRLVADMLHLVSFIVLISKIRGTRNCLGIISLINRRIIIQNPGDLPGRVSHTLLGPLFVLHIPVQHHHEGPLHLLNALHYLLDALQKTLLSGTNRTFLNV